MAPDWRALPVHKIPKRLNRALPDDRGARGNNSLYCWQMGDGPFVRAPVSAGLQLAPDREHHGVVEPNSSMPIEDFQQNLAGTREAWRVIPQEDPL